MSEVFHVCSDCGGLFPETELSIIILKDKKMDKELKLCEGCKKIRNDKANSKRTRKEFVRKSIKKVKLG